MVKPDYMLNEMLEQPQILNRISNDSSIEELAQSLLEENIKRLIFVGSGDSYCASWFGEYLAEHWCSPQFQVKHYAPYEFVNYSKLNSLADCAVLGISVSGGTLRVLESIRFAKRHGAKTIAITDNINGKVVTETDKKILIHASPPESLLTSSYVSEGAKAYTGYHNDVAQTKTYLANLAVISYLCAYLSDNINKNLNRIRSVFSIIEEMIKNPNDFLDIGRNIRDAAKNIFFVASGPNNPTGLFGAYKMFEFTMNGYSSDIEEYCHTRYFITNNKSSVIFIAPDDSSLTRIMEIEPVLREEIQAKTCVLVNNDIKDEAGPNAVSVPASEDIYLSPLVFTIPIEFLSYSLAKAKGFNTNTFRGGVETEKYVAGSYKTIRQSKLQY